MYINAKHFYNFILFNFLVLLFPLHLSANQLRVIPHELYVSLDVENHTITASDRIPTQAFLGISDEPVSFSLHKNLKVQKILLNGSRNLPFIREVDKEGSQIIRFKETLPPDSETITIKYAGEIVDPVEKSKSLSFVTGDHTSGTIAPEGVYLSPETVWVPAFPNTLSKFELVVEIDENYKTVTQGELISRKIEKQKSVSRWKSDIPVDSLVLIAGKYHLTGREVDGVQISTYFLKENQELAEKYIQKCAEYLKLYSGLLGPYPYKRFDIVENFFSSGYGFPYFTLMGSGVFQRGEAAFHPGYLDHEIVHSWWGNYVYNDFRKGNWVEALTTYCANYYYKELKEGDSSAARHRKRVSVAYSQNVKPDEEYSMGQFQGKRKDFDGDIGYGKGSMIFHQLRLTVGDRIFWETLQDMAKRFGGNYAEWEDIRSLFEEKSGRNLQAFFQQWIERKEGPKLQLQNLTMTPTDKGYRVEGSVAQSGELYQAKVPIHVELGYGRKEVFHVDLREKSNPFLFDVKELPTFLKLDPEFHLFRILEPEIIPPNLNATLADPQKVFLVSEEEEDSAQTYRSLVERAMKRKGGRLAEKDESPEELLKSRSVFILGKGFLNSSSGKTIQDNLPPEIKIGVDSFEINGKKYQGPDYSLLLSIKNPHAPTKTITLYYGLGHEALQRSQYIFYYGKDGYLVYKGGRPVDRGEIDVASPGSVFNVAESLSGGIKKEQLMTHVKTLASDEMKGRLVGSPGAEKTLQYIESNLKRMGLNPEKQPFKIQLEEATIKKFRLDAKAGEKESANIYALLKGSDPKLSGEAIIIGAHYDHLGVDMDGNIFRGADDNATGVAAVLEIAEELARNKEKLKRSVIFVFFSGEEWNCIGSKFFTEKLPYPELKKIAMLNVDTIGRGVPGYYHFIGTSYYPSLFNISKKFSGSLGLKEGKNIDKYAYIKGSDHYSFHLKGIPSVDYYSSNYREMNSLKDVVAGVDQKKLTQMAKLAYVVSFQLLTDQVGLNPIQLSGEKHLANITQLTFGGENAEAYFSTGSQNLIFQSTRNGRKCDQIYTMTVAGEKVRMVSTGKGATTCAYYLADNSGIVYASTHAGGVTCPPKPDYSHGYVWPLYRDYDIYRADPDGSNVVKLTDEPGYDAEATVSPDGRKIVFTSVRDGDLELYTMDVDGGNVKRLTDEIGYDGGAFFSADSKKIIYRAGHPKDPGKVKEYKDLLEKGFIKPGELELFIMDADGSNKQQITNNGAANFCPFMHPDGKRVIFSSNLGDPKGRNFDLYIINIDGTGQERLTYNPSFDAFPMFSPDGKKLVFGSNRNSRVKGETNVFVADWVE